MTPVRHGIYKRACTDHLAAYSREIQSSESEETGATDKNHTLHLLSCSSVVSLVLVNRDFKKIFREKITALTGCEERRTMESKPPKARILIVDDEPGNIAILRELLKSRYTVLVATTGQNAVSLAASNPSPDLILLDIKMPKMDGYDVLKTLKTSQRTRNIKIVFVTAKDAIDDKMTAYQKGIEDYITKPIDPDFVLKTVERLTKRGSESRG